MSAVTAESEAASEEACRFLLTLPDGEKTQSAIRSVKSGAEWPKSVDAIIAAANAAQDKLPDSLAANTSGKRE